MGFQPSKKICHAAGQSRLILKHREPLKDTVIASLLTGEFKTTLCNTVRELSVTLDQIKQEALNDEFIRQTKTKICEKDQQTSDIFSLCNEVLLYSEWVVIPTTLQKRTRKNFHASHPGITRMKSLMQCYVYWPNMDKDIENIIKSCKGCALAANTPPIKYSPWPKTVFFHPLAMLVLLYSGSSQTWTKCLEKKLNGK